MSSEESDIEMHSALPKTTIKEIPKSPTENLLKKKKAPIKKLPKNPTEDLLQKKQEEKLTTKIMCNQALADLKSRKGVSLYAIKKYITEKYSVDTKKINYHIKKYIKSAVEEGTIAQIKGVGATGSFKLVPVKEKKPKPKKIVKEKAKDEKTLEKTKKLKEKSKKAAEKSIKLKTKIKENKPDEKLEKPKKKMDKENIPKQKKTGEAKMKKVRIAKAMQTPSKKKATMMKRKSIGSIIKPPKMKPKAQS